MRKRRRLTRRESENREAIGIILLFVAVALAVAPFGGLRFEG